MAECQLCLGNHAEVLYKVVLSTLPYWRNPVHVCQSCADDVRGQVPGKEK